MVINPTEPLLASPTAYAKLALWSAKSICSDASTVVLPEAETCTRYVPSGTLMPCCLPGLTVTVKVFGAFTSNCVSVRLQRTGVSRLHEYKSPVARGYRRQVIGELQQSRFSAADRGDGGHACASRQSYFRGDDGWVRAGRQGVGLTDLHVIGSRGKTQRPAGTAERQSSLQTVFSVASECEGDVSEDLALGKCESN